MKKLLITVLFVLSFSALFSFGQDETRSYNPEALSTVDTTWVNQLMSANLPGKVSIFDMVTDASGNVYLTGAVTNMLSGEDFITIKYNSAGDEQWSAEFNGSFNSRDVANGIAVDVLGNVFVTGGTYSVNTGRDYATIKYNSDGEEQWVAYYDGPLSESSDDAQAIAVDADGNIYVTGESDAHADYDCATIKYSTTGEELWVERYDGPADESDDTGYFIAIDALGYIYVAGRSDDSEGKDDYLLIKYNASGEQQWEARYNGPDTRSDQLMGIVVDDLANVYLCGQSSNAAYKWDYATVMFNSDGVEQWSSRYSNSAKSNDRADALVVNDSGYVYVTGSSSVSGSDEDIITIKYSPEGAEEWVMEYGGPSDVYDRAGKISLDESENVYVSGESDGSIVIKYDKDGMELLVTTYPEAYSIVEQSMSVSGSIIFAGMHGSGYCGVVRYTLAGVKEWDNIILGPPLSFDQPVAMALDGDGNLFVCGINRGPVSGLDYLLVKYSSDGDALWTKFYNDSENSSDMVSAISCDADGNIYLTGQSGPAGNDKNWATVKYDNDGVLQWAATFLGIADYHSSAKDIVVDADGNVYVTGYAPKDVSFSSIDITTIKYNASGEEVWVVYYDGPAADRDEGCALTLDGLGNIYVTGYCKGLTSSEDFVTIKYNPAGVEQWVSHYNGDGNSTDTPVDIGIDHLENVVVCGSSYGDGSNYDFATVQYNSSGVEQWVQRYNGAGNQMDIPSEIGVNEDGDVFVTGLTSGTSDSDFLTIKYGMDGVEQWASVYNGPGYNHGNHDEANALAIGEAGNIYVTGLSVGFNGSYDYATLKYNPEGHVEWETRYDFKYDQPVDVVSDRLGNVYVSGKTTFDYDTETMGVMIKYSDEREIIIESEDANYSLASELSQNYPNPFSRTTVISWSMQHNSEVTLRVYNLVGHELATLVEGSMEAGTHSVSFSGEDLSSGIYFYKLEAGGSSQIKKMMVMK